MAKFVLARKIWGHEAVTSSDFIASDAQHLPFKDGVFDRVVCTEVLEHIPDDRAGIAELRRILKPGGLLAVSVPSYYPEIVFWTISWGYWHSPGGHIRKYKPGQMAEMLNEGGFEIYAQRLRHTIQAMYWFLRCTFGIENENFFVTRRFQKFVQWHYWRRLRFLEYVEAFANPVLGKDLVLYGRKPTSSG